MFDWQLLFYDALIYGLVLSLVLTTLLVISGAVALDMFVDDYPSDIKQKYGPMSARAARLRPYIAALLFMPVLIIPIIGLLTLRQDRIRPIFARASILGITLLVFNIFDLIILDGFFAKSSPVQWFFPALKECGLPHYGFHFIGFLKGLNSLSAVCSLLLWVAAVAHLLPVVA
jgi:hypothetical protein